MDDKQVRYYLNSGQQCYHASLVGGRSYQEDMSIVLECEEESEYLKDLDKLSNELDTGLDKNYKEKVKGGAAGIVVALGKDHKLRISQRGDCQASLFIYNPKSESVEVEVLTTNIHNLSNPEEVKQYQDIGLEVHNAHLNQVVLSGGKPPFISFSYSSDLRDKALRINGMLAVSRVYGDFSVYLGLKDNEKAMKLFRSHEIIEKDIASLAKGGKRVFVIITSDGYYDESNKNSYDGLMHTLKNKFAPIFLANISKGAHEVGQAIKEGYEPYRGDNKTMYFAEITAKVQKPVLFVIFDGHGGNEIAKALVAIIEEKIKGIEPTIEDPNKNKGGEISAVKFGASVAISLLSNYYLINQSYSFLPQDASTAIKTLYYAGVLGFNVMLPNLIYKSLGVLDSKTKIDDQVRNVVAI